jgi:hypothetical protein
METLAPPEFEFHCLQKVNKEIDRIWLEATRPPINLHVNEVDDFAELQRSPFK